MIFGETGESMDDLLKRLNLELEVASKRMRGIAMMSRGIVPKLILSQRALDKMAAAAQKFIADETGEAMIGLIIPPPDDSEELATIYVLDTISPDESAVRQSYTFQQGDDWQGDVFVWLQANWNTYRSKQVDSRGKKLSPELNVPLSHVGDWHKQPGYMIAPSGGDLMTALSMIDDDELVLEDFLLVPIVTLGHPQTTIDSSIRVNYITMPQEDGTNIRVDWWYIHRDVRMFQPVEPIVKAATELPELPPYPWHLLDSARFNDEIDRLNADGLFASVILWEITGQPPLDICVATGRQGYSKLIIAVTRWDYPQKAPEIYLAPFVRMGPDQTLADVFDKIWAGAEKMDPPAGWAWTPDKMLVDYIHAVEVHLGLRPAKAPAPKPKAAPSDEPEKVQEALSRLEEKTDTHDHDEDDD